MSTSERRDPIPTVTVAEILSWEPCEPWPDRIRELGAAQKRWSAREIVKATSDLPWPDVSWLVFREDLIPARHLRELACKFAERALRLERKVGREPDPRSWECVRVARRFVRGLATKEELTAARAAAWDAAEDAAEAVARAAAWDAAGAAARAAARAAQRKTTLRYLREVKL